MKPIKKVLSILMVIAILSVFAITSALASTTIYVKNSTASLLSSPSSKGKVVNKIKKNTTFTVIGTSGNWYKVKYHNKTLYIAKSVVAAKKPAAIKYEKDGDITLATTTSTDDSGLLGVLIPAFEKRTGIHVKVLAVGTGQAIKYGQQGDADVLLVHDRSKEDQFMKDGYGSLRKNVMHNDFVIVGPSSDPAHITGYKTALYAFKKIANTHSTFISRGDQSGTNAKEIDIWKSTGITPSGSWYKSAGSGMAETLNMAKEMGAYTLTDIATYLKTKKNTNLKIFVRGDKALYNPYGVITVSKSKFPNVHAKSAYSFLKFITTAEGQSIIKKYRIKPYSEPVFYPDVIK